MEALKIIQESIFQDVPTIQQSKCIDLLPLEDYSQILVSYSGGKDSTALVLKLLDMGVPKEKIQLWHQGVDGSSMDPEFADWPVTTSYVKAFAEALGIRLEFQYRKEGFLGELLKTNSMSKDIEYTVGNNVYHLPTLKAKISTRRKFPSMSADLKTRWCSPSLKIGVFNKVLNNHPDFNQGSIFSPNKTLVLTGERREESANRAKYPETQLHPSNSRSRLVHWWRGVIDYTEQEIWDLYEKHRIAPHPVYTIGAWNRVSCQFCVFSSPIHLSLLRELTPDRFEHFARLERELGFTIDSKMSIVEKANLGDIKRISIKKIDMEQAKIALGRNYRPEDIIVKDWKLPASAFMDTSGGAP